MTLQNRIDAFGAFVAVAARGTLMGNRGGRIHDPATKTITRRWASKHWICCEIIHKNWHREVMGAGYTELFFLDEVTALASGHRPCALCRRGDFVRFTAHWHGNMSPSARPLVNEIDDVLHRERQVSGVGARQISRGEIKALPDGAMIGIGNRAYALRHGHALPWNFSGYETAVPLTSLNLGEAHLLTPPALVKALKAGYQPRWHVSAGG